MRAFLSSATIVLLAAATLPAQWPGSHAPQFTFYRDVLPDPAAALPGMPSRGRNCSDAARHLRADAAIRSRHCRRRAANGRCRHGLPTRASGISRTIRRSRRRKSPRLLSWAKLGCASGQSGRMLRRRANGPRDGTFRSRTSWCGCRSRWRFPRTATSSTPTRSCPRDSPKASGCRCPRFVRRAARMCITRSSTFVRRIRTGCGTRPSACRSRRRT